MPLLKMTADRLNPKRPQTSRGLVVKLPGVAEIPKCLFPLKTKEGKTEYETLARQLLNAGLLTVGKHRLLSSYVMKYDIVTASAKKGETIRASWFVGMDKDRIELELDALDKPSSSAQAPPPNKFARSGFSGRSG